MADAGKKRRGRGGRRGKPTRSHGGPHEARTASPSRRSGHREEEEPRAAKANGTHLDEPGLRNGKPAPHRQGRGGRGRTQRDDQPRFAQAERPTQRSRAPDAWTDERQPKRRGQADAPANADAQCASRNGRSKPAPQPKKDERLVGFAENIPAFMRKPPRPLKQPGKG
jgi:hypothetical protein